MNAPTADERATARAITAAMRHLYPPPVRISTQADGDGRYTLRLPAASAHYWGVARDPARAAQWINRDLPVQVAITASEVVARDTTHTCYVHLAETGAPRMPDPGTLDGLPAYETVAEVLGDLPATAGVKALVKVALRAALRPHIDPCRSPHGPRYRIGLWGDGLWGVIDVHDGSGTFAEAWLMRPGDPAETRYPHGTYSQVRARLTAELLTRQAAAS
jgi:hypothetical protein